MFTFAQKAAISCILLYFNFAHVNFDLIGRQLNHLRYIWLAAAVLILIAQLPLCALRWRRIVHHCNTPDDPPFKISNAFRYIFIAVKRCRRRSVVTRYESHCWRATMRWLEE